MAKRAARLKIHGVTICISLQAPTVDQLHVQKDVLQHVACLVGHVDYHRVSGDLIIREASETMYKIGWGSQVAWFLANAAQLRTLCILDSGWPTDSMPLIAQFTGLVKLHLNLDKVNAIADFGPLSQLSLLKDLALHCCSACLDCQGVLSSNRTHLTM